MSEDLKNLPAISNSGSLVEQQEFRAIELAAKYAFASQYRPKHIKNSHDVMAVVLYGRELGIPPMEAIKNVHCQEGKFELDYTLVLALIYRKFPGTIFRWLTPVAERRKRCKVKCESPQRGEVEVETRIEEFAYIADKNRNNPNASPWRRHPERMLMAKAVKLVGDMLFPDVLAGSPSPAGPLLSETNKTIDEEETGRLSEKPKMRDDLLTDEQRERKQLLKAQCERIDEVEQAKKLLEERDRCKATLQ